MAACDERGFAKEVILGLEEGCDKNVRLDGINYFALGGVLAAEDGGLSEPKNEPTRNTF
jgi:hypothetical protein